jgi:cytosine/adenosine deaminase-related metal-dependent hydrolase
MSVHEPAPAGITFINAVLGGGPPSSLRIVGARIVASGQQPHGGDLVIDLAGERVLPGLINAHDHLQLNSLPRLHGNTRYRHVRGWIDEINRRRRDDPAFESLVAVPREQRLLLGGIKNLLCGVTTVAHHDPLYEALLAQDFPVRVLAHYGWSHSLYLDGEERVQRSHRATPTHWPWIIHAAEGLDGEAAEEFERLDQLGCITANTLLVHGIALDAAQRARLAAAGAGLIWCPSSNLRLIGSSARVADPVLRGRVALGTDSRLSGSRDLLEELRTAAAVGELHASGLESLVTDAAADLLRLDDRGRFAVGALADLVILPSGAQLTDLARARLRLVMIDGEPRYGDADLVRRLAPQRRWAEVWVDRQPKLLDEALVSRLLEAGTSEPGLELGGAGWRAA